MIKMAAFSAGNLNMIKWLHSQQEKALKIVSFRKRLLCDKGTNRSGKNLVVVKTSLFVSIVAISLRKKKLACAL